MLNEINLRDHGVLILRGLPAGCEVGIDYHVWNVGERFSGISNVPPGFHFVFFGIDDKYGSKSARQGTPIFTLPGQVKCFIFDSQNEEIKEQEDGANELDMRELGKYLAPYPQKECKLWPKLAENITYPLCKRLTPSSGKICAFSTTVLAACTIKQRRRNESSKLPTIEHLPEHLINFTNIPNNLDSDLSPSDRTKHSTDSSYFLEKLITAVPEGQEDVLGEIQYAFVCFIIGQVYDAFDHWKELVRMITNCQQALVDRPDFFERFTDLITLHFDEIPQDFFVDIDAQNHFLYIVLKNFFQNCDSVGGLSMALSRSVSMMKGKLEEKFQWDFDDLDPDDLPTVVDLDT